MCQRIEKQYHTSSHILYYYFYNRKRIKIKLKFLFLAHSSSHGRPIEDTNESGGAKGNRRAVSREPERRHDPSTYLVRNRNRRTSGTVVGNRPERAFHSGQRRIGFAMGYSDNDDTLLECFDSLSLEISLETGYGSPKKFIRLKQSS